MSVGRDPVDRVIDVAIATPVCTALVVRDVVPIVARAGGRGAMGMLDRLLRLPHEAVPERAPEASERRPQLVDAPQITSVAVADLPIPGYDELTARQVCDRLPDLAPGELASIERHEVANRARRTVLGKIERLTR